MQVIHNDVKFMWTLLLRHTWYICLYATGVMARTVGDVIMFDSIFSECTYARQKIELNGSRIGYPINYWEGLDTKANL